MGIVNPTQKRSSISEANGKLEIIIPSRKNFFLIIFLGAWLVGWAVGEFSVPTTFFHKTNGAAPPLFFISAWLLMWTVGGMFAIYAWLWQAFGKEIITVDSGFMSVKRDVFRLGNTNQYQSGYIKNLRTAPLFYNPFDFQSSMQFWGIGGGLLAFDYGAKTYRFGAGIDEAEAKSILERILNKSPQYSANDTPNA